MIKWENVNGVIMLYVLSYLSDNIKFTLPKNFKQQEQQNNKNTQRYILWYTIYV